MKPSEVTIWSHNGKHGVQVSLYSHMLVTNTVWKETYDEAEQLASHISTQFNLPITRVNATAYSGGSHQ